MKKETFITILLGIFVFILVIIIFVLALNKMEEEIINECEKVGNEGFHWFGEIGVNCSEFKELRDITILNISGIEK